MSITELEKEAKPASDCRPQREAVPPKLSCDRCGKCMVDGEGREFVGMKMTAVFVKGTTPHSLEFIQKQLGSYEVNRTYSICFECVLKMMGVPEPSAVEVK